MKKLFLYQYSLLSRLERVLLIGFSAISLVLIPCLILFAWAGDDFVRSIYEQRSLPFFNQLIQHEYPLEHYLAIKKDIALHLFMLWSLLAIFTVSGFIFLYRFFFSEKKLHPMWVIVICCMVTALLYLYNFEMKVTSIHTFFRAEVVYQIMNGNCPPLDPLFGDEVLHYQWGYPWAAAFLSKILNITPFSSFGIINVLSLASCLWLLYKISSLLIDDPKINIFSAVFTIYCGTLITSSTMQKIHGFFPFYTGEPRAFPLLNKFHNNNGIPLGLVFFLLMVYGTMKLFEKKKSVFSSFLILLGTTGSLFFYAAFGPGILAWVGVIALFWLTQYKSEDFRAFGRTFVTLFVLTIISVLAVLPYFRQISSSGGFWEVEFFNLSNFFRNSLNFLVPVSLSLSIIIFFRKYLADNLNRRNLCLLVSLFLSNMACYLLSSFPARVEYKFLLLSLLPFGIIGGIAFCRIKYYSKWLALGLFFILALPSLKLCRWQFESSPRNIFDIDHVAPYYENGTCLESRDLEENAMYRWIRKNSSMNTFFLDKETKIPVYAQRSLWVGFDNGQKLPGYEMTVSRIKEMHGYDEQEFSRRQQIVQNIFGHQQSLTEEEVIAYLTQHQLLVVVRDDNIAISTDSPDLKEIFTSEKGRFRIIAPSDLK